MAIDIKKKKHEVPQSIPTRYVMVGALVAVSFFAAYTYAQNAKTSSTPAWASSGGAQGQYATAGGAGGSGGSGGGGGCCGGGGSQQPVAGATTVEGGVQKVTIDLTTGSYSPNQITAKAGVPLELDFKGPASGCNGYVQSQDMGFQQDVSNGGTIKVGPLKPGTYSFACSMNMYTAQIVVK